MKKLIYLSLMSLFIIANLNSVESLPNLKETEPALVVANEMKRLNNLISITEKNLENQKKLKQLFLDYQQQQVNYLQNSQDKEVTLQMVKTAYLLLEGIKANHLIQTFDTEFISQLTFFSQFVAKQGVPKT